MWKLILGLEVDDLVCRYFFTRCLYLRQGGDEKSRLQQTAYVKLYNVTKFPLYMSFSVPCEQRPFDLPRKIEGPLFYALLSCPTDLALPYPILSYPIPSLSILSHPIPSHPILLLYPKFSPWDMSPSVFIFLQDLLYFQQLKQYVVEYDMLVDSLITKVT